MSIFRPKKPGVVITSKDKWSRRQLLSRIGKSSTTVALMPFVPIMEAGAQTDRAVRYVQWFNANASSSNNGFWQSNNGAVDFPNGSPYEPYEKYKDHTAVIGNVYLRSAKDVGKNPHNETTWGSISGRDSSPTANGFYTLDQAIAEDLRDRGINTLYKSLVFGFKNPILTDHTISINNGNRANADRDPRTVYDRLFKAAQSIGGGVDTTAQLLSERKLSVLDYVDDSLKKLKPIISSQDRQKLDFHLNSILEVEARIQKIEDGSNQGCNSFRSEDKLATAASEQFGDEILEAFTDLMVAAFTCDMTRVVAFQMSFGHDFHSYPWLGYSGDFHAWTHGLIRQEFDASKRVGLPGAINRVKTAMKWRHEKIVSLMDKLNAVNEPDGTLLDNTGILNWTETSRAHDYNNATWVLSGKMGDKINTGQYRNYGGDDHNKLLTTIAQAMGMNTNRFGASKYDSGTLPGLLK